MNVHDRVEPMLAEHALGTLDAADRMAVDAHLAECASCSVLHEELATAVAQLEDGVLTEVPAAADVAASRATLLAAAARTQQLGSSAPFPRRARRSSAARRWMPSPSGIATAVLAAACVLLLVAATDRQDRIDSLERRLKDARGDQVAAIRGASVKDLDTGGAFGDARAQVVLRRDAGVVLFRDVPAPADGMVWQVWAISGDRIDSIGVIDDARASAFLALDDDLDADAVERIIVTLEPEGGSTSPAADEVAAATV